MRHQLEFDTMSETNTLRDSLIDEIKDLYSAEKQLTKALPKLAKNATDPKLRAALESHLGETNEQISRLEQIFDLLDEKPRAKHCAGMAGIIEEGNDVLEEDAEDAVMDACIIAAGQRAEHYEMAAYGTCIAWAKALSLDDVATLLEATLKEEKSADEKLSALAESGINEAATAGEGEGDDEESDVLSAAGAKRAAASATSAGRVAKPNGRRRGN
jgi:ferritin-like metal-binding protein YciE